MSGSKEETRANRYLLNQLPEEERDRFEEELIADDDAFADMLAEEDDLLDAYVHGALDDSARHAVQQRYLTHPELRSRLEFAQTLKERNVTQPSKDSTPAGATGDVQPISRRGRILPLAVAAALVLVLAGVFAYRRGSAPESEIALKPVQPALTVTSPAPLPVVTDTNGTPLLADTSTEHVSGSPIPHAIILTFTAAVTRGAEDTPALSLNGAALQLELNIDPAESFDGYRIEVSSAAGKTVFSSPVVGRQQQEGRTWIEATVPPNLLGPGKYDVHLSGISHGAPEDLAFHQFEIRS